MCNYYTLLTPSPSGESPTIWRPYWYGLVTESLMFPMWTSPSEYGARAGRVSMGPPSGLWGGGRATTELVVMDDWFVSAITDNSESSLVDSTNCHFQWSKQALVLAISCRHFPTWEALLRAVLARACAAYSSNLAAWVRVTPACLPSQMARSFIGISTEGCDPVGPRGTTRQTRMNRQVTQPIRKMSSNTHKIPETTGKQPLKEGKSKCYECGQKGHMQPQCPKLRSQCIAMAREDDSEEIIKNIEGNLEEDAKSGTSEQEEIPPKEEENLNESSGEDDEMYSWDELKYKANYVRFISNESSEKQHLP